ncbi:MAG: hypothetical protein PVH61_18660, partial [Candidatus Aminicenantes bacterium]
MINRKINVMTLVLFLLMGFSSLFAGEVTFFGPKQYTRNKGKPVTVEENFTIPLNYAAPGFTLTLTNGSPQGENRVSSAEIKLNGEVIFAPKDFNQNVGTLEHSVELNPVNLLSIKLNSKPDSYLVIHIHKFIYPPEVTFTANPDTIDYLQSSTLSWTVTNADSIQIDNGIGPVNPTGSLPVSPEVPNTTYTLTSSNLGGETVKQVSVMVIFPVPTVTLQASPLYVKPGTSSTLTWTSFAAHTVTIEPGIGAVELNGSRSVSPTATTLYTITALGYGGTQTDAATVNVDGILPLINVTEPVDGSYLSSSNVVVRGNVIDSSPVILKVNGSDVPLQPENYFEVPLPLNEGANTIRLDAEDAAGNLSTQQVNVIVDTIAPQVQITAPQNNAFLNTPVITVTGTLVDANPDQVILNHSQQGVIDGSTFTISNVQLTEGTNTLNVEAVDKAGNRSQVSVSCTLDTAVPVIAITEPANDSYFNTSSIIVKGTVQDSSPLTVKVNGVEVPLQNNTFETSVNLIPGQNTIQVEAIDAASNPAEASVSCTLDQTAPVISISEPTPDSFFNTSSILVKGTVQDSSPLTVKVNGVEVSLQDNIFETSVNLVSGQNNIQVEAIDAASNPAEASVSCTLDQTAPVISISEPTPDSFFNTSSILVKGTVQDSSPLTVKVNGVEVPLQNNTFETSVNLSAGQNTIQVEAIDAASNPAEASVSCTLDQIAPVVVISSPQEGTIFNEIPITVTGTVTEENLLKVLFNNQTPVSIDSTTNTFMVENVNLVENENQLVISAEDKAGNISSQSVNVIYIPDNEPPVLTVTSPADNSILDKAGVTVTGTVVDKSAILYVKVNGITAVVDAQNNTYTVDLTLSEGENTVTVESEDEYQNKGSISITVTVDSIAPQVTVNSPVSGSFFTSAEVVISGEIIDATAVSLSINGQAVPPENISGNQFNHPFTLVEGENNLTISARDAANHSSQTSLTLFLDSVNPQITVSSPSSGSVTNKDKITITGSITDAYPHQVTLSGGSAGSVEGELIGSNFYFKDIVLSEGENTFTVVCQDRAGNSGQFNIIVVRDSQAPQLSVQQPVNGAVFSEHSVLVKGTAADDGLKEVRVNNIICPLSNNEFSLLLNLVEGSNIIEIKAS